MNFKRVLGFSVAVLLAMGCESPLFHHAVAKTSPEENGRETASQCQFHFPKHNLCASFTFVQPPTLEDTSEAVIRFWDSEKGTEAGPYVNPGFTVGVKLWMASMGHGSSPVKVKPSLDSTGVPITGVYAATEIFFVMGGDWELWVQLKDGKNTVEQAKIDMNL